MKKQLIVFFVMALILGSCDFKETRLINVIHKDGTITRKVTIRTNDRGNMNFSDMDIPIDSTWKIEMEWKLEQIEKDTIKLDTVWYIAAEKHFSNVEAINLEYQNDKGANKALARKADLSKSFRWFTTVYRYSEQVDKLFLKEVPLSEFYSLEEVEFACLPAALQESLIKGSDSLKYQVISQNVEARADEYLRTVLQRELIYRFYDEVKDNPNFKLSLEDLLSKEGAMIKFLPSSIDFQEMNKSFLVFGQTFIEDYHSEIEKAIKKMGDFEKRISKISDYDIETTMPGKIVKTNGYLLYNQESEPSAIWVVGLFSIIGQDYEMWVESRVYNYEIWVVSVMFLFFVVRGFYKKHLDYSK